MAKVYSRSLVIAAVVVLLFVSLSAGPAGAQAGAFACSGGSVTGDVKGASVDQLVDCVKELRSTVAGAQAKNMNVLEAANLDTSATPAASPQDVKDLADVEDALRTRGDELLKAITEYERLRDNPAEAANQATYAQKIKDLRDQVQRIKSVVTFSDKKLFVNAEDYDDYFFRFNTGYEFVNIDNLFNKGTPRLGFLVNLKLGGNRVTDLTHGWHGAIYGWRLGFASVLNSSAEQDVSIDNVGPQQSGGQTQQSAADDTGNTGGTDNTADTKEEVKQSLGFELQLFAPLHRTLPKTPNQLRSYFGLLATAGGRKTEDITQLDKRYYGGLRFGINPELYWDLLYGTTESLSSKRLELRGQLPIHIFGNGDRLYLGAIGNFAADGKGDEVKDANGKVVREAERDVIRVYLSWNADLKQLFGGGG